MKLFSFINHSLNVLIFDQIIQNIPMPFYLPYDFVFIHVFSSFFSICKEVAIVVIIGLFEFGYFVIPDPFPKPFCSFLRKLLEDPPFKKFSFGF